MHHNQPNQPSRPNQPLPSSQLSSPDQSIRLNKFLAERLGLSRREADDVIARGEVLVNQIPAILGARVVFGDEVVYRGEKLPFETEFVYVAMNKPVGYVCSRRAQGDAPTIYELLPKELSKLKTVGRLDKDSSGLILLTNDGDFAFSMTHPKFLKTKIYEVILDHDLTPLHQQEINDFGVQLDDGVSKFGVVRNEEFEDRRHFLVTLTEGRNRQIRRTFAALGYTVVGLHRLTFGKYQLDGLEAGRWVKL